VSEDDSLIQFKQTDHWSRVKTYKETASQFDKAVTSAALPGTTTGEQPYKDATYFYTTKHIGRYNTCASSKCKAYAHDEAIELESDVEQHNAAETNLTSISPNT